MPLRQYTQQQISSGAASTSNHDFSSQNFGGVRIFINVSVFATGPLDFKLQALDNASSSYIDIPGAAFTQIAGVGLYALYVGPNVTAVSGKIANSPLSHDLRLVETLTAGSATRTINVEFIN